MAEAAILNIRKIAISQKNNLTGEIWYGNAYWPSEPKVPENIQTFKYPKWRITAILKVQTNHKISPNRLILMNFDMVMQLYPLDPMSQ